jgi:TonB family protein
MNEPASDIIAARARVQPTLTPTLAWSIAGHLAIVAAIWLAPARSADDTARVVMTVSLGGASGPRAGGLTPMGGRAVPERPPEPPKPTPRTPPPPPPSRPAAPSLPAPNATPARPARTEPARSAPAAPEEPREGNTRVETGARGQGFGLATGGEGPKGLEVENVTNFCCPGYLELVRVAIERAWSRAPGMTGTTTMRFRILRNGTIDSVSMVQSSGNPTIDAAAQRALVSTRNIPALPNEFPDSTLTLRMRFENRRSGEY